MHLVLVISSLQAGGAERVAATMANVLAEKMQVTVCTLSSLQEPFYPLSPKVELLPLDLMQTPVSSIDAVKINIKRIKKLKETLRGLQPSVVVSFMLETNIIVQLASIRSSYPLVICEHTDPRFIQHKLSWRFLRVLFYWSADRVVVLNGYMQRWFGRFVSSKRILVLPNPVDLEFNKKYKVSVKSPYILAAGRLVETKRFSLLIELFSQIAADYPDWKLVIAGDGELKNLLQNQVNELGLPEQIKLIGKTTNLADWMKQADIFVSTSELEAFPMVICEAMLCETPVVISAYNDGAYKLVNQKAGFVTNEADLQWLSALQELMSKPEKRKRMAKQAAKSMQLFLPQNVIVKWLELFSQLGLDVRAGTKK